MPQITDPVAVGSLIAIQHFSGPHRLGLVVNQEAGERWVARDPFRPVRPESAWEPLIVRIMGECSDTNYPNSDELWDGEPRRSMTTRWAYVQTRLNPLRVIAGPETHSIEKFFGACLLSQDFGAPQFSFMVDLHILIGYLKQNKPVTDETGVFERRYRAMLAEVLPIPR